MNRRQKIVLSVTGIFLVLLILVGLTYAYFLTRIDGNEAEKSISVTTANLALTYSDGNGELTFAEAIVPGDPIKFKKTDGTVVTEKTFSVTNNGDDTEYVVFIDDVNITYASDVGTTIKQGDPTTFESNDFRYILTCTITSTDATRNNTSCNSVNNGVFPLKNESIMVGNDIIKGDIHNYTLTMEYLETGRNQSKDMNKTLSALINIEDINRLNPYKDNTNSLAYNIIENSRKATNGTELVNIPLTSPAEQVSGVTNYKTTGEEATFSKSIESMSSYISKTWYYYDTYVVDETTGKFTLSGKHSCTYNSTITNASGELVNCYDDMINKYLYNTSGSNNSNALIHAAETKTNLSNVYKITSATVDALNYVTVFNSPADAERVLAPTIDEYGSSYYYRGDVEDNYVNFAGMCWRIVRIEGDGSVKLILEDSTYECDNTLFTGNWSDGNKYVFGYDTNNRVDFLNYTGGLADSFKTFQTTLAKKINTSLTDLSKQEEINETLASKLKIDEWCYDDKVTETDDIAEYYGAYTRIMTNQTPSLNCTGTKLTKFKDNTDMYVGTLTADEIVFAGADSNNTSNHNYYLINNYSKFGSKELYFWSLSPAGFGTSNHAVVFLMDDNGSLAFDDVIEFNHYSRPAVTLASGSVITEGNGTLEKPYIIG